MSKIYIWRRSVRAPQVGNIDSDRICINVLFKLKLYVMVITDWI